MPKLNTSPQAALSLAARMPNVTLSVKKADVEIWVRARAYCEREGVSLSSLVAALLEAYTDTPSPSTIGLGKSAQPQRKGRHHYA